MAKNQQIILISGEASGDLHGAHLVEQLKKLKPNIAFSGLGGPKMEQAGVKLYEDLTRFAVVGFVEVLKHLRDFKRIFKMILNQIEALQPAAVILIDYPGFNLRLAKAIKTKWPHLKIIYYISPQIWAWKENRVQLIRSVVDKMLVILPFEKEFYAKHGINVEFVGHPLLEYLQNTNTSDYFFQKYNLSKDKYTIALLPGSRQKEVEKLLPIMLKTAQLLYQDNNKLQFILIQAPTVEKTVINDCLADTTIPVKVIAKENYEAIHAAQLCIVASGTATLEIAIQQKPMVIIYKTSFLTWLMAKCLVKIPYIGLVNVIAQKKIVPELIQSDADPVKIARELKDLYSNELRLADMKSELKKVRMSLGNLKASETAAKNIIDFIPELNDSPSQK